MKRFYLLLILLTLSCIANSQLRIRCATSLSTANKPLIVVDSFVTGLQAIALHPDQISNITILKNVDATRIYGDKAIHGVIIIQTKPGVSFFRLHDLLTKFNIAASDSTLRVGINHQLVDDKSLLLVDRSAVCGVEIIAAHASDSGANAGEKFINIVTTAAGTMGAAL